ncbi:MAG: hypothetical protein JRS35_08590 [Deltaproteobacteria bacterium]|nr:hypothetical protein [Deltaproteobacteria bacterium]
MRPALGMLAVFGLLVLVLEPASFGLPGGHHGYVTANHLAIVRNADVRSYFVGYVGILEEAPDAPDYFYFNRAPFFFEALVHPLLGPVGAHTQPYVYWGHQVMNGVYLLTLFVAFRFLCLLLGDPRRAALAALAAFSGHYFLYYKNLVEPHQLGVLAVVLVLYGSARLLLEGDRRWFWLAALAASCMGEAAPAAFTLALLNALVFAASVEHGGTGRSVAAHLRSPFFAVLCASALVSFAFISYNVLVEAAMRDVPVAETGVVDAAMRRLGFAPGWEGIATLGDFAEGQLKMIRRGLVPEALYQLAHLRGYDVVGRDLLEFVGKWLTIVLWLAGIVAVVRWFGHERGPRGLLIALALLSGPAYMLPLRRIAHFHDFFSTYYVGLNLVFWAALLRELPGWGDRAWRGVVAAIVILSLWSVTRTHLAETPDWPELAAEVDRARAVVGRGAPRIHAPEGWQVFLDGVPPSLFFFFPDSIVTLVEEDADYLITRHGDPEGEDLLPANRMVRVFAP